jgi:hypothetical protein
MRWRARYDGLDDEVHRNAIAKLELARHATD